ncbi:MAG: ester cyclase [Limnoraphis robusta]|nr:ester cyclase [Limnoraphis robusta]MEA5500688.1 ester cyclase [Limnoraphis robusta BA-68 BA1]
MTSMVELERLSAKVVNEAIVRRFWNRVWNAGQLEVINELVSENCTLYCGGNPIESREKLMNLIKQFRKDIINFKFLIEDLFVYNQKVVTRWKIKGLNNGFSKEISKGEPIELTGITIFELEGNTIKKGWLEKSST